MSRLEKKTLSQKNPFYISKARQQELKWFCRQYGEWKKELASLSWIESPNLNEVVDTSNIGDPVTELTMRRAYYLRLIKLVEDVARETDESLLFYILKGMTEGASYTTLRTAYEIPCCQKVYNRTIREFLWRLSAARMKNTAFNG